MAPSRGQASLVGTVAGKDATGGGIENEPPGTSTPVEIEQAIQRAGNRIGGSPIWWSYQPSESS